MKKVPRVLNLTWEGQKPTHPGGFNPLCQWVADGEGVATVKLDGTACLVRDGHLFARYDAKHGKVPPPDFEPAQEAADPNTGHWPGWVPVTADKPQYKHHHAAFRVVNDSSVTALSDGTYELCGPHFQTNPYGYDYDVFHRHGAIISPELTDGPRTPEAFQVTIERLACEGIVFHHPDGRMAKVCADEFGIRWKALRKERREASAAQAVT